MNKEIRFALPSKGRMQKESIDFLKACGLIVEKPNPRQYQATISALPNVRVIFQRPSDIVVGVREGSLDFGITGLDLVAEKAYGRSEIITIHDSLGFGKCYLGLAVPSEWRDIRTVADLAAKQKLLAGPSNGLRIATKYPKLTADFLEQHHIAPTTLIESSGTLEVAPAIGYADFISDLVSTGTTLRANRLRPLADGDILHSQGALVANRAALQTRPDVLSLAHDLIEFFEAHLRGRDHYLVIANMRGKSGRSIAQKMADMPLLSGLQGPTIAPIFNPNADGNGWFSVSIAMPKTTLTNAIAELRQIGGSGVIVTPVTYIFEEEPARYRDLLRIMNNE